MILMGAVDLANINTNTIADHYDRIRNHWITLMVHIHRLKSTEANKNSDYFSYVF